MCANVNACGLGDVDLTITNVSGAISFGFIYSVGIIYEQMMSNDVRFHNVGN